MDILSNPNLSDAEKRRQITGYTEQLISSRSYEEAATLLHNLLYSGDPYVDQRIMDEELRAYYIFACALLSESGYGAEPLPLLALRDEKAFVRVILETKFALRRIWFDIPGAKDSLAQAVEKYGIGPALIAETARCSLPERLISPVIKKAAKYIEESRPATSAMLLAYAEALGTNGELPDIQRKDGGVRMVIREIDAREQPGTGRPEPDRTPEAADEKAIAFIACANDQQYVSEISEYLKCLDYPEGYQVEAVFVWNAPSMAAGYDLAMKSSRARYKIYIHQDVFISDREFIVKLIRFFNENDYDMLGVAGGTRMPESGKWALIGPGEGHLCLMHDLRYTVAEVRVNPVGKAALKTIDGVFIATRTDVPWRDDLFTNFHFYDVSQAMEFTRRGLRIGFFDNGGQPGLLHEVSFNYTDEYDEIYERERIKFLREYEREMNGD